MAKSNGSTVVLLVDLNAGQKADSAPCAEQFELNNQLSDYANSRGEVIIITQPRGQSHIDHILTSKYKLKCSKNVDTTDELIHDKSDHVPLVADFSCHNIWKPPSNTPTPEHHIDISVGGKSSPKNTDN